MALLLPAPKVKPTPPGAPVAAEAGFADQLLPPAGPGFLLPFLLAALRPNARRWLGTVRLKALAGVLKVKEAAVAQMLDAPPSLPDALRESGTWTGRRVPLLGREGRIEWLDLHWRPDTQAHGTGPRPPRPENGSFAARLTLSGVGRVEVRGRLEQGRLDAVAEVENALRKPMAADMEEAFTRALVQLGISGSLTVRSGRRQFRS